jgi:hypothetical protein
MLFSSSPGHLKREDLRYIDRLARAPEHVDWMELALSKKPVISPGGLEKSYFKGGRVLPDPHELLELVQDRTQERSDTGHMNDITREEFNAKLETIEVKMDARVESVSSKIDSFLASQAERDKAQIERDKRFELLAERVTKAAEGAEEAAKQAATVKSNYWAAVIVQLLAVVAILVGAYYANQANVLGAMQTTMSAFQAGKAEAVPTSGAPTK